MSSEKVFSFVIESKLLYPQCKKSSPFFLYSINDVFHQKTDQRRADESKMSIKTITVVHCWSAPRSRSTALLYSFEARGEDDCVAIDEPLYRDWLIAKGDAVARPYLMEMMEGVPPADSANEASPDEVEQWKRELLSLKERIQVAFEKLPDQGVIFCKHMAKHSFLYNFDEEISMEGANVIHRHLLLIRDPVEVLSSWGVSSDVHQNNATSDEVGVVPLLAIYSKLESRPHPCHPVVLESNDLVIDPAKTLRATCESLGIAYKDSMLTWNSGKHKCDGPWAAWWYHNVWKSDGWNQKSTGENKYYPETKRYRTLNPILMPALHASFPAYEFLRRLSPSYQERGPPTTQIYEDPRNEHLLVWVGAPNRGRLIPRDLAGVSPWDSSVQGGDACWEGIRVYRGKILSLEKHLGRLFRSAKALGFKNVHTKEEIIEAIFNTLAANGMRDNAHMRLTLTRGEKCTSSMNPNFNVYGTTLIILAEWKPTEVRHIKLGVLININGASSLIGTIPLYIIGRNNLRQHQGHQPNNRIATKKPPIYM